MKLRCANPQCGKGFVSLGGGATLRLGPGASISCNYCGSPMKETNETPTSGEQPEGVRLSGGARLIVK
jgi:hypothetical protein